MMLTCYCIYMYNNIAVYSQMAICVAQLNTGTNPTCDIIIYDNSNLGAVTVHVYVTIIYS